MIETFFTSYYDFFMPLIILLAIILLFINIILTIIAYRKTNNKLFLIIGTATALIFLFISYLAIPYYSTYKAIKSDSISAYNQAIKTEIIPYHKGMLHCNLAGAYQRLNKGQDAIKNYEMCYSYTNNYKDLGFAIADILYLSKGDYKKAIEISQSKKLYELLAEALILQNKYNMALDAINKDIEIHPYSANAYKIRAIIYKNLNQNKLAYNDFNKALSLCKQNDEKIKMIKIRNEFKNYKTCVSDKYKAYKIKYGF